MGGSLPSYQHTSRHAPPRDVEEALNQFEEDFDFEQMIRETNLKKTLTSN